MIYRRFGKTNLRMPVFSCGGMRYQQKWSDLKPEEIAAEGQKNLEATIRRALEIGINHIETARGYGSSEMQLGWVLPSIPRDKLIVQTKVAPFEDPRQFVETFNKSMDYLRLDHVDLLGIHGVNTRELHEWTVRPGGCFDAALKLKKEGRVRHIGFSTHAPLDVMLEGIRFRNAEGAGFEYINLHWYYILQHNWPAIEDATKHDLGVFIISPSDKGGRLYAPPEKLVELCRPLHPMVFNDLFCLSRPQVHTLSIGAARPSDFDRHLETLPLLERAPEILPPIVQRLEDAMLEATGVRRPEEMSRDLPNYDAAPGGINLQMILWLRNLTRGWGMTEYAKFRYNLLGNGGHWFPGLPAAKLDQVPAEELRSATAKSAYRDRVPAMLREAHELLGAETVKRLSQG
jgi:uncharacterized protein